MLASGFGGEGAVAFTCRFFFLPKVLLTFASPRPGGGGVIVCVCGEGGDFFIRKNPRGGTPRNRAFYVGGHREFYGVYNELFGACRVPACLLVCLFLSGSPRLGSPIASPRDVTLTLMILLVLVYSLYLSTLVLPHSDPTPLIRPPPTHPFINRFLLSGGSSSVQSRPHLTRSRGGSRSSSRASTKTRSVALAS